MRSRVTCLAALAVFVTLLPTTTADGAPAKPTLVVAPADGGVGDVVLATLEHWPAGLATIAVCGDGAAGTTSGCDLRSAYTVHVPAGGRAEARVVLLQPPAPCPCVVRAWTSNGSVTGNANVAIAGVPVAPTPPTPATSTSTEGISVKAEVRDHGSTWSAAFAGPLSRELVVTIRNAGPSATPPLHLGGGVGRDIGGGEPFPTQTVEPIASGATRVVTIPLDIGAPTWGDYVAYGTLFGLDRPVRFRHDTSTDPWGLELVVPVLLLVYAQVVRRRERKVNAARAQAHGEGRAAPREPVIDGSLAEFPERSPDVGEAVEGRCGTPPYAPEQWPHEVAPPSTVWSGDPGDTEAASAPAPQLTPI